MFCEITESLGQDNRFPGEEFNPEYSEYEAGMLASTPRCFVCEGEGDLLDVTL
jgi:hypothetical protein